MIRRLCNNCDRPSLTIRKLWQHQFEVSLCEQPLPPVPNIKKKLCLQDICSRWFDRIHGCGFACLLIVIWVAVQTALPYWLVAHQQFIGLEHRVLILSATLFNFRFRFLDGCLVCLNWAVRHAQQPHIGCIVIQLWFTVLLCLLLLASENTLTHAP